MRIAPERFVLSKPGRTAWFGSDFEEVLKYGLLAYGSDFKIFNNEGSLICSISLRPYST